MSGPVHKRAALTCEGFYVGTQHPMALVLRKHDLKLISCSTKKIVVYESPYIAPLSQVLGPLQQSHEGDEPEALDVSLSSPEIFSKNDFLEINKNQANQGSASLPIDFSDINNKNLGNSNTLFHST